MGVITTVTGNISSESLGVTLSHEHLYCDISPFSGKTDNRFVDVSAVIDDLVEYKAAGGGSVLEMTPRGLGQSTSVLKSISQESSVNIVSGIGLYDNTTYPEHLRSADEQTLTGFFVEAIEVGTDGVRAGFIGELYSHNDPSRDASSYTLHDVEVQVFRAAAQAHVETGVAIYTHASIGRAGLAQLRVLDSAGADLNRVAIGHCDAQDHETIDRDIEYYLAILERGAMCGFDLIGWTELMSDEARADRIAALVNLGYAEKLLLSTDTCRLSQLKKNGGRGYDAIFRIFLPLLKSRGVTNDQIRSMLVEAPRRLLESHRG